MLGNKYKTKKLNHPSRLGKSQFAKNVSWNVLGNLGGKLLAPIFQILIARLLLPEEYGLFAIALAWLAILDVGKDLGVTHAIVVRQGGKSELDLQFTIQLGVAFIYFLLTLIVSPFAGMLLGSSEIGVILIIVSLVAFMNAISDPIITEHLVCQRYQSLGIRQIVIPLTSGLVGYTLASKGYGVYALVIGLVAGHIAGALLLITGQRAGRAKLYLNWPLTRQLMVMGKHIVMQRFFGFLVSQADTFIVGKTLGPQALGFYRVANSLVFLLPGATVSQVQQVIFTEASAQPNAERIRKRYEYFTKIAGAGLLLYSLAVYILAPILIPLILGKAWVGTVPLIQVFSSVVITGFITSNNIDLAKVLGFIDVYTKFSMIRSAVTLLAVLIASQYSILHVVLAWAGVGLSSNLINDVIFFKKQSVIRLSRAKLLITAFAWLWAIFVMVSVIGE